MVPLVAANCAVGIREHAQPMGRGLRDRSIVRFVWVGLCARIWYRVGFSLEDIETPLLHERVKISHCKLFSTARFSLCAMARPPRLHPGRKSQRSAWRTLLPVVGCIVTFYVIWSVYSNPTMRSRDSKSNPVETVDERAQSAKDEQRTCYPETDADYYGEEALHHEVVVRWVG